MDVDFETRLFPSSFLIPDDVFNEGFVERIHREVPVGHPVHGDMLDKFFQAVGRSESLKIEAFNYILGDDADPSEQVSDAFKDVVLDVKKSFPDVSREQINRFALEDLKELTSANIDIEVAKSRKVVEGFSKPLLHDADGRGYTVKELLGADKDDIKKIVKHEGLPNKNSEKWDDVYHNVQSYLAHENGSFEALHRFECGEAAFKADCQQQDADEAYIDFKDTVKEVAADVTRDSRRRFIKIAAGVVAVGAGVDQISKRHVHEPFDENDPVTEIDSDDAGVAGENEPSRSK